MISQTILMCHAPIVIPKIGGEHSQLCKQTTQAMAALAKEIVSKKPDGIILVSPHAPRLIDSFGLYQDSVLKGDFGAFGFPDIRISMRQSEPFQEAVFKISQELTCPLKKLKTSPLDHGAMVPFYFLQDAGWVGPSSLISLPENSSFESLSKMGETLRQTSFFLKEKWVIVASGDMSHRLFHGAPCGFHPHGKEFDLQFVSHLKEGSYDEVSRMNAQLRKNAAEDVVDSFTVAVASLDFVNKGHKLFSYEGPFGVGYSVARLQEGPDDLASVD